MKRIETRTIIAYLLIAALILAAAAGIAHVRRNNWRRRYHRDRSRPASPWASDDAGDYDAAPSDEDAPRRGA